jgi:hypothetical protein
MYLLIVIESVERLDISIVHVVTVLASIASRGDCVALQAYDELLHQPAATNLAVSVCKTSSSHACSNTAGRPQTCLSTTL